MKRSRHTTLGLQSGMWIAAILFAIQAGLTLREPVASLPPLSEDLGRPLSHQTSSLATTKTRLTEVLNRSLLPPKEKKISVLKKAPTAPASQPSRDLERLLRIVGVFTCSDPAKSRLIVETLEDQKQHVLSQGGEVSGVTVETLSRDIVLRFDREAYRVEKVNSSQGGSRWGVTKMVTSQSGSGDELTGNGGAESTPKDNR